MITVVALEPINGLGQYQLQHAGTVWGYISEVCTPNREAGPQLYHWGCTPNGFACEHVALVQASHPATQRPRLGCGCTADSDARTCHELKIWGRTPIDYDQHGVGTTPYECLCRRHKEANCE